MSIERAITKINPNASFSIENNDINQITWEGDTTPISISDIEAQLPTARFEVSLEKLRAKRDALLNETDWIVTKAKETGTTIPTAWKTYRQALRDITENLTTVEEVNAVVFPEKP